jgi:endonuclease-3
MAKKRLSRESTPKEREPAIVQLLKEQYPAAKSALNFSNPLECLVAVILSAQCTDERVNRVTDSLFEKYAKPEDYVRAPEAELAADIKPTGFFNQKTRAIRGACTMILDVFGGRVPDSMADLIKLPGVARKTANIVLGNSYPEKATSDPDIGIAVDTHVRRVSNRLGFTAEKDPEKIERDLMRLLPPNEWFGFSYLLIEHGRAVCKAPTPRCEICVINHLCPSSRV